MRVHRSWLGWEFFTFSSDLSYLVVLSVPRMKYIDAFRQRDSDGVLLSTFTGGSTGTKKHPLI